MNHNKDMTQVLPLPQRLIICPWGQSTTIHGQTVIVDETTVARFAETQESIGGDEIALDFEHGSYLADQETQKKEEPVKVAAYGTPLIEEEVGLSLDIPADKWTAEGKEYYQGKHYRDLSPVLLFAEDGQTVIGVSSVALTRRGAISGLHAFSASLSRNQKETQTHTMNEEEIAAMKAGYDTLKAQFVATLKALGLEVADDSSPEQIMQAAAQWQESTTSAPNSAAEEAKDEADKEEEKKGTAFSATLAKLRERQDKIEKAYSALQADRENAARNQLIDDATRAGKRLPVSRDKLMAYPTGQLKDLLDGLRSGEVAFSAATPAGGMSGGKPTLTASQLNVCQSMGIKPEDYAKNL